MKIYFIDFVFRFVLRKIYNKTNRFLLNFVKSQLKTLNIRLVIKQNFEVEHLLCKWVIPKKFIFFVGGNKLSILLKSLLVDFEGVSSLINDFYAGSNIFFNSVDSADALSLDFDSENFWTFSSEADAFKLECVEAVPVHLEACAP